jgi:methyl-accepting chemotaxis protein
LPKTIEAGSRYLDSRDSTTEAAFRKFGWASHDIQRQMNEHPGQSATEVATVATIDNKLSSIEIDYALAHRLVDLGRVDDARKAASRARRTVDDLLNSIDRLGKLKADKVAAARSQLATEADRRSGWLIAIIGMAVVIGVVVVMYTVRRIGEPLDILVRHAQRLSEGDLTSRAVGKLPGEFSFLAAAMNQTGESLSRVVSVAARTAEDVSSSAHDLASVSEQISLSAGQMANAMTEVSHGADAQVKHLRNVDYTLQEIREAANGVKQRSSEVTDLARNIEGAAQSKRIEIDRALGILVDVKHSVELAAEEIRALNATGDGHQSIRRVGRSDRRSDELAGAERRDRSGASGRRGTRVCGRRRRDSKTRLSNRRPAADDIVRMTAVVTGARRVEHARHGNERESVAEIESVSRDIDSALRTISDAAEQTRVAAVGVTSAAEANAAAATTAANSLESIAKNRGRTRGGGRRVNASTQEQSAACEQMTSASNVCSQGFDAAEGVGRRVENVAGCWLLVAGCWLLVAGCWLRVTSSDPGSLVVTSNQ